MAEEGGEGGERRGAVGVVGENEAWSILPSEQAFTAIHGTNPSAIRKSSHPRGTWPSRPET